jgi:SAM-dependent methyltransferase
MPHNKKSEGIHNAKRRSYWVDPDTFLKGNISLCDHAKFKLLYNELAPIFDLAIARDTKREVNFLSEIIKKSLPNAKKILDLGCGIGRHDELLNKDHTYKVTGIDSSRRMIEHAKMRCPDCRFLVMDFRNILLKVKFDAALCMWTTFNYLSDLKEVENFFKAVRKVLCKNGLLIIDMNNYGRSENSSYTRNASNEKYGVTVDITKKSFGNVNEALYSYLVKDLKTGKEYRFFDQELNRIYTLEHVIAASKPYFKMRDCFGDYDSTNKFDLSRSERIVMILQKKGSNL